MISDDDLFDVKFDRIYFCYFEEQPLYAQLKTDHRVIMIKGLPDNEVLKCDTELCRLVIIDDGMMEISEQKERMELLMTRGSSHWNLSVIQLMQSMFPKGLRTIRTNCNYVCLLKSPADTMATESLGRQIFPRQSKYWTAACAQALRLPYSYILVDLHPTTKDYLRVRTGIFSDDGPIIIYVPDSKHFDVNALK